VSSNRIFMLIAVLLVLIITAVSFLVLKKTPEKAIDAGRMNKAELIYGRAEGFLKTGEQQRAVNALSMIIEEYPDPGYAEKSLRKLAAIYLYRGDYARAKYYYKKLLEDFPGIKDAPEIQSSLEDVNMRTTLSPVITEDSVEYEVQQGDTLFAIAKNFKTTVALIKKINGLQNDVIRPGQKLKIIGSKFSIFVDKSRNVLVLKKDGEPFKTYVISTGKDNCTPVGMFKVEEKMVRPVWYKVGAVVDPDSQEYELGERWIGLSVKGYGIHGTSDESTIGKQITRGCVRMHNKDVIELYDIIPSGTETEIVD
jgi:lipoprotein-anchoring transpeptidase ErfK/SrfK